MKTALPADIVDGDERVIWLTRLNRVPLVLNCDLIEHIEVTPDTVITLTTGQIVRVRETADEVVARVVEFRRRVYGAEPDLQPVSESANLPASGEREGASGLH